MKYKILIPMMLILMSCLATAIEFKNEEFNADLTSFEWCFDSPFDNNKNLFTDEFLLYNDNLGCDIKDHKIYSVLETVEDYQDCTNIEVCTPTEITNKNTTKTIDVCHSENKCVTKQRVVENKYDLKKTDFFLAKSDRICVEAKRSPKVGQQNCDMNFIYDDGNTRFDVADYGKQWWNVSYSSRRQINCSGVTDSNPIMVNFSTGFGINGVNRDIWTYCHGDTYIYYNNESSFAIANDTNQLPHETLNVTGLDYDRTTLWTNYLGVYHMDSGLTVFNDSSENQNMVGSGSLSHPDGVYNWSTKSDGQSEDVELTNDLDNNNDVTINAFVYKTGNGGGDEDFISTAQSWAIGGIRFQADYVSGGNVVSANLYRSSGDDRLSTSYTLPSNSWHMLTLTLDVTAGTACIYVNGTNPSCETHAEWTEGSTNWRVPSSLFGWDHDGNQYFVGHLDEVTYYDGLKTAAELSELFNNSIGLLSFGDVQDEELQTIPSKLNTGILDFNTFAVLPNTTDEDEKFRVFANYTYTNNTVISNETGVVCNYSADAIVDEYAIANYGTNISVCSGGGCDSTNYTFEFTGLENGSVNLDTYLFSACRSNNIQNFHLTTQCGDHTEFAGDSIPTCDAGFVNVSLTSLNCSSEEDINISIWSDAVAPVNSLVLVDTLAHIDRNHDERHDLVFNNSLNLWVDSSETHSYIEHGTKLIDIVCYDPAAGIDTQTDQISILVVNRPPIVFIDTIWWWLLDDPIQFANDTEAKYPLQSSINITLLSSDDDLDTTQCYFNYSNGTNIFSAQDGGHLQLNLTSGNFSTATSYLDGDDGYLINIVANDTTGNTTSLIKYFDATNDAPVSTWLNSTISIGSIPSIFNFTCTDAENETLTSYVFVNGTLNQSGTQRGFEFNYPVGVYELNVSCGDSFRNSTHSSIDVTYTLGCDINVISPVSGYRYQDNSLQVQFNCTNSVTPDYCYFSINDYAPVNSTNCAQTWNITAERGWNEFTLTTVSSTIATSTSFDFWAKDLDADLFDYPLMWVLLTMTLVMYYLGAMYMNAFNVVGMITGVLLGFQIIAINLTVGLIVTGMMPLIGLMLLLTSKN